MNKQIVLAVIAVAAIYIGASIGLCANYGHAVAVNPVKKTPYEMCAAHYKLESKKAHFYYTQWWLNLYILKNHNIWQPQVKGKFNPYSTDNPKFIGKPILSAKDYAKLERTCYI
jgi:hypothetical protein